MTLNLNVPVSETQLTPRITVIGVGGAGGNAVNNMIQSNLEGVDFLVANTDAQALAQSLCKQTIQIGRNITQGLGRGLAADRGRPGRRRRIPGRDPGLSRGASTWSSSPPAWAAAPAPELRRSSRGPRVKPAF